MLQVTHLTRHTRTPAGPPGACVSRVCELVIISKAGYTPPSAYAVADTRAEKARARAVHLVRARTIGVCVLCVLFCPALCCTDLLMCMLYTHWSHQCVFWDGMHMVAQRG